MGARSDVSRQELVSEALGQRWYHTIDLGGGLVTDGVVDLRRPAGKILPQRLDGLRALDVGTFDGFWAFELERRGASVVATDLDTFDQTDWPPVHRERLAREAQDRGPGERFHLAASLLGSEVQRVGCSIYDLAPELVGGRVDVALVGDLLLHLRDPVRGLESVRSMLAPGGRLFLVEQISPALTLLRPRSASASLQALSTTFNWWVANARCLRDWLTLAGFARIERRSVFRLKADGPQRRWHVALEAHTVAS